MLPLILPIQLFCTLLKFNTVINQILNVQWNFFRQAEYRADNIENQTPKNILCCLRYHYDCIQLRNTFCDETWWGLCSENVIISEVKLNNLANLGICKIEFVTTTCDSVKKTIFNENLSNSVIWKQNVSKCFTTLVFQKCMNFEISRSKSTISRIFHLQLEWFFFVVLWKREWPNS